MDDGRRSFKTVTNAGQYDGTEVYYYDGQKIIAIYDGSANWVSEFIHGTRYIDEHIMVRVKDKGELYYHQGEQSERERPATGKADMDVRDRAATCPAGVSTRRTTRGANFNVVAMTDMAGQVIERYTYTPYGQLTVDQVTSWGNRDLDDDVDSDDKGTPGTTCSTMSGACRVVDLDPVLDSSRPASRDRRAATRAFARGDVSRIHRDYAAADGTLFDSLPAGLARHPAKLATGISQPFGHQGLLYDAEITSYQNRARQYMPGLRRFAQRDPLALSGGKNQNLFHALVAYRDGVNLYEYVRSSPMVRADPDGLRTLCGNIFCSCESGWAHWPVYGDGPAPPTWAHGCMTHSNRTLVCSYSCSSIAGAGEPGDTTLVEHECCHICDREDKGWCAWLLGGIFDNCDSRPRPGFTDFS